MAGYGDNGKIIDDTDDDINDDIGDYAIDDDVYCCV